jgi:prevent-host-death family protein
LLTLTASEARNNIGKLWEQAAAEPVLVESAGKPLAVVMSPQEYDRLTGGRRKPRVAGTGANLLADVDVDALLATPIDDVFADYM